jgi:TonB family protein
MRFGPSVAVLAVALAAQLHAAQYRPPQLLRGDVSGSPPETVGFADVWFELTVDAAGTVEDIDTLRTSEPLTSHLLLAVAGWTFEPAREDGKPVPSHVLVAAIYRPPALFNNPVIGTPSTDVKPASAEVAFPLAPTPPNYPANTVLPPGGTGHVVVVEVLVGERGDVQGTQVVSSTSGLFNETSLQAARQWKFRPARRDGLPIEARAYLIFGFRQPVTP